MLEPELPDLPTAWGRGRWDWKEPGDDTDTVALLILLVLLCTGPEDTDSNMVTCCQSLSSQSYYGANIYLLMWESFSLFCFCKIGFC